MKYIFKKNLLKNKFLLILIIIVTTFSIYGGFLRIWSSGYEASYWNDESHVAKYGRAILETGRAIDASGYGTGLYQIAMYYITALSFKLLGINEFAGRLPSVIIGTSLIPLIAFITYKLRGYKEAIIAAFLMAFSQMQLAWSTQLRPYIWMEVFTIIIIYLCYKSLQLKKRIIDWYLISGGVLTMLSFLFHGIGLINGIILAGVFVYKIIDNKEYRYLYLLIPAIGISLYIISFTPFFEALFRFNTFLYHYFVFLAYHYNWLLLGAGFGTIVLWFKDRKLSILLTISAALIVAIALFKIHDRYVRYSITAFPLLYMLFGIGVVGVSDYFFKEKHKQILGYIGILVLLFIWPFYKHKIILSPKVYYSINADMRENPIVNYKLAFQKIGKLIKGKEHEVAVMDAWYDRIMWYLPEVDHYYLLLTNPKALTPNMIVTIDKFEKVKSQYKYGVIVVENWQSLTPPELQDHIRKTLKHEFDVQTVPGNEADSWSISVYSWGL